MSLLKLIEIICKGSMIDDVIIKDTPIYFGFKFFLREEREITKLVLV